MKRLLGAALLMLALSPLAALAGNKININTADAETLQQLRGVGPAIASAIVAYREANGPFNTPEDLVKVPGIGERSLERMRDEITVEGETSN